MNIKTLARSFAAGIIGPELYGRLDLTKFQTGLAQALNWWVLPHGPAQNRPGFGYVLEAQDSTQAVRIIPFSFNTEQTYILELGASYLRVHTQGATLLETGLTITGITQDDPGVLTYTGTDPSNGDWFYLASIGGMTELNGRYVKVANVNAGANTFELTDIYGGADIDTTGFAAYTSGGTASRVYSLSTPYAAADLFDIHFVQSADVLTLTHPGYAPRELRRTSATSWEFVTLNTAPTIGPPTSGTGAGTPVAHNYKVTAMVRTTVFPANEPSYSVDAETQPSSAATGNNDLDQTGAYNALTWSAVVSAVGYRIYKDVGSGVYRYLGGSIGTGFTDDGSLTTNASAAPPASGAAWSGGTVNVSVVTNSSGIVATPSGADTTTTYRYVVTSVGADNSESYRSAIATCTHNLASAGNFNTITWPLVAGAARYNIYKESNGLYGYIGQAAGTSFVDDNILPDISQTPPVEAAPFVGGGNYPGAVGYHEQRRCFAATNQRPQNFWATKSGTESDLSYSIPSRDDDAIAFRIAAREVNRIRHIVSLDQLVLLTSGGEWVVSPKNSDVLTPSTASPRQISAEGASNVQPAVTSSSVIYVQESGSRVREMKANIYDTRSFDVRDISILAPHLFDDYTLVDLAYAKTPYKMVWAVRSDGKLLGMTYLPEQDVIGWHLHETDGLFESVACVKEGSEHILYAVVRRTINGRTVRNIERMSTRRFATRSDSFFVDSGLTYSGAAATTISGLWHLEGEDVAVLADGAEVTGLTVTDGAITLPVAASKVHVGLAITADIQTLPLSAEMQAFAQGVKKNVNGVALRLKDTSGLQVGPTFDDLVDITTRSTEPYDSPPDLFTGVEDITVFPEWNDDAQLCIRQSAPLPATILSMVLEVAIGG